MKTIKTGKERIHFLDEIRGFAILCMVIHHAFYDIGYLLKMDWGFEVFDVLCMVQPFFWIIFIVTSGICTNLSRNTLKRGLLLFAISIVITIVTAVIMPLFGFEGEEIYFGIIHCLAVSMIITGLLKKFLNKLNIPISMLLCLLAFALTYFIQDGLLGFGKLSVELPAVSGAAAYLFPIGITSKSFTSADYFPLLPWFFMFLFGAFAGRLILKNGFPNFTKISRVPFLQWAGKNSLWIYVCHQVVLYALFLLIKTILKI